MEIDREQSTGLTAGPWSDYTVFMRHGGERSILVVDDDPDILQTLALCLSTEGYRILVAANGREALDVLDKEKPSVILLDLMMPVMDGWQFVAALEERGKRDTPLLILSADRAVQGHAHKLRANGHLAKPFDLEDLLVKVAELIGLGTNGHGHGRAAHT
jgi:CheY-like chemotaxis protein